MLCAAEIRGYIGEEEDDLSPMFWAEVTRRTRKTYRNDPVTGPEWEFVSSLPDDTGPAVAWEPEREPPRRLRRPKNPYAMEADK